MKKYALLLSSFLFFLSCKEREEVPDKDLTETKSPTPVSAGDVFPNAQTRFDTLYTTNTGDNVKLLAQLQGRLLKAGFSFEKVEDPDGESYADCEQNRQTVIRGAGMRKYFARSKKPEKGTKDFYPDFTIRVYEFPTAEIAQQQFEVLQKALYSAGRFCNGKAPFKMVINGNEVFHLATRAEMFRTYTERYGEMIKNFR